MFRLFQVRTFTCAEAGSGTHLNDLEKGIFERRRYIARNLPKPEFPESGYVEAARTPDHPAVGSPLGHRATTT